MYTLLLRHDQWLLRTPIACNAYSRPLRADPDYPALTRDRALGRSSAVPVPTGWQDEYVDGPSIQPSRGQMRGWRYRTRCRLMNVRDVESPQQPG